MTGDSERDPQLRREPDPLFPGDPNWQSPQSPPEEILNEESQAPQQIEMAAPIASPQPQSLEDSLYGDQTVLTIDRDFERSFLTGIAGSGKSYLLKQRAAESDNPNSYLLCSTTGASAVNLGPECVTVHSTLGFFDYASLEESYMRERLTRRIVNLAQNGIRHIQLDEVSMLSSAHLEILHRAFADAATRKSNIHPCALELCGDWLQLPPIPDKDQHGHVLAGTEKFAFEAPCWPKYAENMTRLTESRRHSDPVFLQALNAARSGNGTAAAALLQKAGVEFVETLDPDFPGTTLRATLKETDKQNEVRLMRIEGDVIGGPKWPGLRNFKWGTPQVLAAGRGKGPGEWKTCPDWLQLKVGAYVRLRENEKGVMGDGFYYVNGDAGTITDWNPTTPSFLVQLDRGRKVMVTRSLRLLLWKHAPKEFQEDPKKQWPSIKRASEITSDPESWIARWKSDGFSPLWIEDKERWLHGAILWWPICLAWATNPWASQGWTLEKLQIEPAHGHFGSPAAMYVALSRCKSPSGLRIVGTPDLVAQRTRVDPRCLDWI